jgi:hypothetical protein
VCKARSTIICTLEPNRTASLRAVRVGFEPTTRIIPCSGFQDRRTRPTMRPHLSGEGGIRTHDHANAQYRFSRATSSSTPAPLLSAPGASRTPNPNLRKVVLYPVKLQAHDIGILPNFASKISWGRSAATEDFLGNPIGGFIQR